MPAVDYNYNTGAPGRGESPTVGKALEHIRRAQRRIPMMPWVYQNPFAHGDFVVLPGGERGEVESIGIRSTRIGSLVSGRWSWNYWPGSRTLATGDVPGT